jgi:hypothetical protein
MVLKLPFALKDAIDLTNLEGPLFTRRGTLQGLVIQSRLDRSNTLQNTDLKQSPYLKADKTIVQKPANLEPLKAIGRNPS